MSSYAVITADANNTGFSIWCTVVTTATWTAGNDNPASAVTMKRMSTAEFPVIVEFPKSAHRTLYVIETVNCSDAGLYDASPRKYDCSSQSRHPRHIDASYSVIPLPTFSLNNKKNWSAVYDIHLACHEIKAAAAMDTNRIGSQSNYHLRNTEAILQVIVYAFLVATIVLFHMTSKDTYVKEEATPNPSDVAVDSDNKKNSELYEKKNCGDAANYSSYEMQSSCQPRSQHDANFYNLFYCFDSKLGEDFEQADEPFTVLPVTEDMFV
jgi:hypothetical protein